MNFVKRAASKALQSMPLWFWERVVPKDVIGLGYHIVSDEDLPHQVYYSYKNARQFENDVVYAKRRAVDYDEVARHRLRSQPLPRSRLLFTFDDGFAECFHVIRPILRKHSVPGVFFVTTSFLDDRRRLFETSASLCLREVARMEPERAARLVAELSLDRPRQAARLTSNRTLALRRLQTVRLPPLANPAQLELALWLLGFEEDGADEIERACALFGVDPAAYARTRPMFMSSAQVRQLAAEGFTIGSHGLTHLPMQRAGRERMEQEIVASCSLVRDLSGQKRVPYAFPYGGSEIKRSVIAEILRRHDFVDLFFDTAALRCDEPFIVNRVWADPPPAQGEAGSNLSFLLRSEWAHRSAWRRKPPAEIPMGVAPVR
jgi:peptidoglycan/xylan/chitin deacetylase (PgdA/CDA1 family)